MKKLIKLFIANVLNALAYHFLIIPNKVMNGGVTNLAIIIKKILPFDISTLVSSIMLFLLLLSYLFLGIKNMKSSTINSLMYMILFKYISKMTVVFVPRLIISIVLAAVMISISYFICISNGASMVGVDVIAIIINRNNNSFSISKLILLFNTIIIAISMFINGITGALSGLLLSFLSAKFLDKLLKLRTDKT